MSEIILKIEEITFKKSEDDWQEFDGYQITTDKQIIKFGISNSQGCCEYWGYFSSNDDLNDFIGSELLGINLTDTALNTKKLKQARLAEIDEEPDLMFATFKTNNGEFQLTAYNQHNGYYGHDAVIISQQLTQKCVL